MLSFQNSDDLRYLLSSSSSGTPFPLYNALNKAAHSSSVIFSLYHILILCQTSGGHGHSFFRNFHVFGSSQTHIPQKALSFLITAHLTCSRWEQTDSLPKIDFITIRNKQIEQTF